MLEIWIKNVYFIVKRETTLYLLNILIRLFGLFHRFFLMCFKFYQHLFLSRHISAPLLCFASLQHEHCVATAFELRTLSRSGHWLTDWNVCQVLLSWPCFLDPTRVFSVCQRPVSHLFMLRSHTFNKSFSTWMRLRFFYFVPVDKVMAGVLFSKTKSLVSIYRVECFLLLKLKSDGKVGLKWCIPFLFTFDSFWRVFLFEILFCICAK